MGKTLKCAVARGIYEAVIAAMAPAEELGGPEGTEYLALMEAIAKEATARRKAAKMMMEPAPAPTFSPEECPECEEPFICGMKACECEEP